MMARYWHRKSAKEFGGMIGPFGFERVGAVWWLRAGPMMLLGIRWRFRAVKAPVA